MFSNCNALSDKKHNNQKNLPTFQLFFLHEKGVELLYYLG